MISPKTADSSDPPTGVIPPNQRTLLRTLMWQEIFWWWQDEEGQLLHPADGSGPGGNRPTAFGVQVVNVHAEQVDAIVAAGHQ